MSVYEKLKTLGITLPELARPGAVYIPFVRTGNLVYVSGHIARREGKPWVGQLGAGLTTDEGKTAARAIAVELMGTLQAAVGDLDRIARIVKLMVLGKSAPTFTGQHLVAQGASELMIEDQVLYPALVQANGGEFALLSKARAEHVELRRLVSRIRSRVFDEHTVCAFVALLREHLEREIHGVFALAEELIPQDTLVRM